MNKSRVVHIGLIVISIVLGGLLAGYLNQQQRSIDKTKSLVSQKPLAGFHKFSADVEWMKFINYMGSLKTVDDSNKDQVIARLERLIDLDPNFDKVYQVGVMSLSVKDPDKAVELLEKACDNPALKKNWKIPFYAGFILTHHFGDKDPNDPKVLKSRAQKAKEFFKLAIERSGGSPEPFVVNSYIRTLAKTDNEYIKNPKKAVLKVLFSEWKSSQGGADEMSMETSLVPDIEERILATCQQAKAETPNDAGLQKLIDKVKGEVLSGKHLCEKCMTPYSPGDKFCSCCGAKVIIYGICPKCNETMRGKYCSKCGWEAPEPEKPKAKKTSKPKAPPAAKKPQ